MLAGPSLNLYSSDHFKPEKITGKLMILTNFLLLLLLSNFTNQPLLESDFHQDITVEKYSENTESTHTWHQIFQSRVHPDDEYIKNIREHIS